MLVVLAVGVFIKLQPPPLALLTAAASAPVGPLDGTWALACGSAGFRVQESALGMSNDLVGRTTAVSGSIVVSSDQVSRATFRIDLTTIKVNRRAPPVHS